MSTSNPARLRSLASRSLRERIILTCLLVLVLLYGVDFLFDKFYLESKRELQAAVLRAEEQVVHNRRLLAREESIHAQYRKLESPVAVERDSVLTETEVLRELSELSVGMVHVKSVVPRLEYQGGRQIMCVALDFEGPFEAVIAYVEKILNEMPTEVSTLSLSPRPGDEMGVICRMSVRVDCFES